ncbi:2-amino-4-hydroxy-6-hydroxymethyldihydropteridine diphosphokinase [Georgenia sp. MJ206]|uniref:2-amino-4-hydroxy-6- hydroxymethyldihydropteridine diphosphokinase n=1 Tax=Georgenia wangjunii TaxID=3117730 RepID=UPI002F25F310
MRPVLDVDGRELDQVTLTGVSATGHHGVLPHERTDGQTFRADVVLHLDTRPAARTDALDATVNYAAVAEDVVAVLAGEPADLTETVAARLAERVLARAVVCAVDVTVHKPQAPITVPFSDVSVTVRRHRSELGPLDRRPEAPVGFVVSAGANLGDARATLRHAAADLAHHPEVEVTAVSPLARTAPVLAPGAEPQPDYLNAVLVGRTSLSPRQLLALCQRIELAHGRVRRERWGPRTLDLDVIAVGEVQAADEVLMLPHPRAHERAFVLRPWAAAAPDATLPGRGPVAALAEATDASGVIWVEDASWAPTGRAGAPGGAP